MPLLKVVTLDKAFMEISRRFSNLRPEIETVPSSDAFGRFLAAPVFSSDPVPHFARSTMDGYAVKASDTFGASETIPSLLKLIGEVEMGRVPDFEIASGETAYIPTGGMIPEGADAVIMVEYSEAMNNEIALLVPAAPGLNILPSGHDIKAGELLFNSGRRLGPPDLGALSAAGIMEVPVFKKPSMALISTGSEIDPPGSELVPARIRDINSITIKAEAERMGYSVVSSAVVKDDRKALEEAVRRGIEESDVLFLSGGSSAGNRDFTLEVFNLMGDPGGFVHGIAFNPGKPTILADAGGLPLVGLPGHPVSSFMVFRLIGRYLLHLFNGADVPPLPWVKALLTENVHGSPGRDTYKPVYLRGMTEKEGSSGGLPAGPPEYEAVPVGGGSGMITTLTRADGYMVISRDSEGMKAGSIVRVYRIQEY